MPHLTVAWLRFATSRPLAFCLFANRESPRICPLVWWSFNPGISRNLDCHMRRALALRRGNSSCARAIQTPGHVTLNLASPLRHSAGHSPSRPWRAQWQRSFLACSSASGWNTPVWRYNLDERSATIWGSSAHLVQRRDSRGLRIGACHEIPMPRRPIFDRPMTAAERQRRCRARKRQAPAPQARACQ